MLYALLGFLLGLLVSAVCVIAYGVGWVQGHNSATEQMLSVEPDCQCQESQETMRN